MAIEELETRFSDTLIADEALTAYTFVTFTTNGVSTCDDGAGSAGQAGYLILETYADGDPVAICTNGVAPARANGNSVEISAGDYLKTDASGELIKAATTGDIAVARALQGTDAANALIRVLLFPAPYIIQ
jgi:hypothetical protein